jgi:hypothetical protein
VLGLFPFERAVTNCQSAPDQEVVFESLQRLEARGEMRVLPQ